MSYKFKSTHQVPQYCPSAELQRKCPAPIFDTSRHVLGLAALPMQNMAFAFLLSQCNIQLNRLQKKAPHKEKVKLLEISSCFFLTWVALSTA